MEKAIQVVGGSSSEGKTKNDDNNNIDPGRMPSSCWNYDTDKKLFGREVETQQLDDILQRQQDHPNEKPTFIVIKGMAGSGKSSFVRSYPWKDKFRSSGDRIFVEGKFESRQTITPYSAVVEAMNSLFEHYFKNWILNQTKTDEFMERFRNVLENDAGVLRNILPKAFRISEETTAGGGSPNDDEGKIEEEESKPHHTLYGTETSSALPIHYNPDSGAINAAFCRIISFLWSTIKTKESASGVTIFLDDIQWADQSSLDVIQALISYEDTIKGIVVVVSYRSEEVNNDDTDRKVSIWLDNIVNAGININTIEIGNLDIDGVNQLVASVLRNKDANETLPLAEVIHNNTAGNAFFVLQFLQYLRDEKLIKYSYLSLKWEWDDIEKLKNMSKITDNVADVIVARIHRLPVATQICLQVASCLGNQVSLDVLQGYFDNRLYAVQASGHNNIASLGMINEIGLPKTFEKAVESGILTLQQEGREYPIYTWSHDKLQHSCYFDLSHDRRRMLHFYLGKVIWKMSERCHGAVFAAADQLDRHSKLTAEGLKDNGAGESESLSLGVEVAKLNMAAARLCLGRSALFPAMKMLQAGARNLMDNKDRWRDHYDLCLQIYSNTADIGMKIGLHEVAMAGVREVEANAKCVDDKFQAHCALLSHVVNGNNCDYDSGITKAIEILGMYGEKFPTNKLNRFMNGKILSKQFKAKLRDGLLEGIMDLPESTDSRAIKVTILLTRYLSDYITLSTKGDQFLQSIVLARVSNIACEKGICEGTVYGMLKVSLILKAEGQYQEALEFAELAIKLIDRFPLKLGSFHGPVKSAASGSIVPLMLPMTTVLERLLECHRIGLQTGDTENALIALMGYSWTYFNTVLPIGPLLSDCTSYEKVAKMLNAPYTVQLMFKMYRQTILDLQEYGNEPTAFLKGDVMDQEEELKRVEGAGKIQTTRDINTFCLMLTCIYNRWDIAESIIDQLECYFSIGFFFQRAHFRLTYLGLASYAVAQVSRKRKYRSLGKKVLKIFKKEVQKGSLNAFPILKMLEAEDNPSKETYEEAIKTCARLGLMNHEAYMCERAGTYFLNLNDREWGRVYLERALSLYNDWGATGKSHAMVIKNKEVLGPTSSNRISTNTTLKGRTRFEKRDTDVLKAVDWNPSLQ